MQDNNKIAVIYKHGTQFAKIFFEKLWMYFVEKANAYMCKKLRKEGKVQL